MPLYTEFIKTERLSNTFKHQQPLAGFTSWRIGGSGEWYATPSSEQEIRDILLFAQQYSIPLTVLGGGSNVLISDQGLPGIVLHITHRYSGFDISSDGLVRAKAGTRLGTLIRKTMAQNLSGIEQLWGIPGTIGGAVTMNAGACNTEFFDHLISVTSMTPQGEKITRKKSDIIHGYRYSDYKYNGEVVLEALLQLSPAEATHIQYQFDLADERRKPQHNIRLPNSGSVFRNPDKDYAGRLIEVLGGKGRSFGQAQVSLDHANFIVNKGKARAQDACRLIASLQRDVWEQFSVQLEPEVIFLGEF